MKKRTLILPLIAIGLAMLLCCVYLFFISTYGILYSEGSFSDGFLKPNRFAYTMLRVQLRYVSEEYAADYYEHLLKIYYNPNAQLDFVDSADARTAYESYFALLEKQKAADETSTDDIYYTYRAPNLFTERTFTDSTDTVHIFRSDNNLYVFYLQTLYRDGACETAKEAYDAYFDQTDNLLTYRYFLTDLLSQNDLPQADRDWAIVRARQLLEAIRQAQADYLAGNSDGRFSPYDTNSRVEAAIYDLTLCLENA